MEENPLEDYLKYIRENDVEVSSKDIGRAENQEGSLEESFSKAKLDRYTQDTEHRRLLSTWAGILVSFWLISVLLILTNNTAIFKLSDSVLMTLLGTTTLNVLGLMVIVLNDIFGKSKKEG